MMICNMLRTFISSVLIGMLLISCSTGKKAYERGDYYAATLQAVNRLRSNPDSRKALEAVKNSYPMALKYFQDKIDYSLRTNSQFKYSETAGYYEMMNHLSDEVSRCPAALNIFPEINFYTDELVAAKKLAAEEQYNAGLANEEINTRDSWKDAFYNYKEADGFVPGYKDAIERMEIARFNATLKVIVEPIPVPRTYQITSDFFLQQIIESLERYRPNEFVQYYSPESAEKNGIEYPDQVLRMNFDEFVIGQVYDKESMTELSRDSVEVGSVTMPDGTIQKVYGTVKAKLTNFRREIISNGRLDVTIIEFQQNRVATQQKFSGQFVWFTEWATFNGDERALSNEQLALCARKPAMPPPPQDLFVEFTRPIYDQVTPFLRSFYRKY